MITVNSKDLKIGMYVSSLDRPWEGTPFLFQGFLIKSDKQIVQLQTLCKTVQVDALQSDKSLTIKAANATIAALKANFSQLFTKSPAAVTASAQIPKANFTHSFNNSISSNDELLFVEEMAVAKDVYKDTSVSLHKVLTDFRLSRHVNKEEVTTCVNQVIISVMRNPNALLLLTHLRSTHKDTVRHSINVCILALLLARYLKFDEQQLSDLGFAALLHDVGESKVAIDIVNKCNRGLSVEEKVQMEKHTEYGFAMLRANAEIPAIAAEVAYSHHERVNGKGYPRGLEGDAIHLFARLLAIVDIYETVTNYPATINKVTPANALKLIYSMRNSFFDGELVEEFIKCLGVYPIGSVVQISNGEIGIVIDIKQGKNLLPMIMLVKDSGGKSYNPPNIINLDTQRTKDGLPSLLITKVLDPSAVGIDLSEYIIRSV
jgi:putative nucleotidyltransferase with HDIG domain